MDWTVALISLIGTIVNIKYKNRICFLLWLPGNAYYFYRDLRAGIYGQATLMFVYIGLSVWGYISWKENK